MQHRLILTERTSRGATFATRDVGPLLETDDRWFRPVDIKTGPNGALYVADWYDTRLTHMDPRDTWDRERGRIYRVRRPNAKPAPPRDLAGLTSRALVTLLDDPRKWHRQQALRLLGDRGDRSVIPQLTEAARRPSHPRALDALWAIYQTGGLTPSLHRDLIRHPQALVRQWAVRLLGETERDSGP